MQSVRYADYALGKFIQELKGTGLWKDSVFVVYGDHFGLNNNILSKKDKRLFKDLSGHEYSFFDQFNVPLIIRSTNVSKAETFDHVGGQIDIMPTVTNLLGVSMENQIHFGLNLFQYKHNLVGGRRYYRPGTFINNQVLYLPEGAKTEMHIYDFESRKEIDPENRDPQYKKTEKKC